VPERHKERKAEFDRAEAPILAFVDAAC